MMIVEFKGKAAHAAADPWNGRSALAGLEFFTTGLNRMREFVKPSVRMHYTIIKGGDVPNVVPEYTKVEVWLRDSKRAGTEALLVRVKKIAEGAALMAEVESKLTVTGGDYEMLVNLAGEKLIQANFDWLFGCNPWGTSMVYGLPSDGDTPVDPHSSLTHLKQYPIDGGLVDGPVYGNIYKNLIHNRIGVPKCRN